MELIKKWKAYLGPKDEYLEAEENRAVKVGYGVLLAGTVLVLYYQIMLQQVASVVDDPIYTALGERMVPSSLLLALVVLASGIAMSCLQMKSGAVSSYRRYATVDRIPWGFTCVIGLVCGAAIGVLTFAMRVIAEMQIVGLGSVMWLPDVAIGIVMGGLGFAVGIACFAAFFASAIKRRKELEQELED